jgi:hypothetical protein
LRLAVARAHQGWLAGFESRRKGCYTDRETHPRVVPTRDGDARNSDAATAYHAAMQVHSDAALAGFVRFGSRAEYSRRRA